MGFCEFQAVKFTQRREIYRCTRKRGCTRSRRTSGRGSPHDRSIRLCACTNVLQRIYITNVRTSAEERVFGHGRNLLKISVLFFAPRCFLVSWSDSCLRVMLTELQVHESRCSRNNCSKTPLVRSCHRKLFPAVSNNWRKGDHIIDCCYAEWKFVVTKDFSGMIPGSSRGMWEQGSQPQGLGSQTMGSG